jgi:hypothetical protein
MAIVSPLHRMAVHPILDLFQYRQLKRDIIENTSAILTGVTRVVAITDRGEDFSGFLKNVKELTLRFGAKNIRCVTLECALPKTNFPKGVDVVSLSGVDTTASSPELLSVIESLKDFAADTFVVSTKDPHSALRRIILRTHPKTRISIGDTLPYPFSTIRLTDREALLQDYFL